MAESSSSEKGQKQQQKQQQQREKGRLSRFQAFTHTIYPEQDADVMGYIEHSSKIGRKKVGLFFSRGAVKRAFQTLAFSPFNSSRVALSPK